MKNKIIFSILPLLALIFTSCSNNPTSTTPTEPHQHVSNGYKWDGDHHFKYCTECGQEYARESHKLSLKDKKDANCSNDGYEIYSCSICGFEKEVNIPKNHNHPNYVVRYNETQHYKTCTLCAEEYDFENHDFHVEIVEPTFSTRGYEKHYCTKCDYYYLDNYTNALEHNYSNKWTFDKNYHWHQCIDEGYENLCDEKTAHQYVDVVLEAATFETTGTLSHECECGYKYETSIPKLEHNYASKLSYDKNGHYYACVDSGYESLKKDYQPHNFSEIYVKKPTCLEEGKAYKKCSCGYQTEEYVVAALGHDLKFYSNNDVFHKKKCSRCNYEETLAHSYIESPDSSVNFRSVFTCQDCGHEYKQDNRIFSRTYKNGSATITGLSAISSSTLIIPETLNNFPVGGFNLNFAENNAHLEQIYFPSTISGVPNLGGLSKLVHVNIPINAKSIGGFSGCSSLTSIALPDGITTIGNDAFKDCSSLVSVNIPNTVTSIGINAFNGCSSLTSIILPNSLTSIGTGAFSNCKPSIDIKYQMEDTSDWLNLAGKNNIEGNLHVLDDSGEEVAKIKIPESVTQVNESMFNNWPSSIKELSFPDSLLDIPSNILSGCSSIEKLEVSYLPDDSLSSLFGGVVPDSLKTVRLGKSYYQDFTYQLVYDHKIDVESIEVDDENPYFSTVDGVLYNKDKTILYKYPAKKGGTFVVPSSVTTINDYAFVGCSKLQKVIMADSVVSVGKAIFGSCTSLSEVTLSQQINTITLSMFSECSSLKSLTIPDNVIIISNYAFANCVSLKNLKIGNNIQSIGSYALENCDALVFNTFDNGKYLGNDEHPYSVFVKGLGTATSMIVHDDCRVIYEYACRFNRDLQSLVIGENVVEIGFQAFCYCSSLSLISFNGTVKQWNDMTRYSYWCYEAIASSVSCKGGIVSI